LVPVLALRKVRALLEAAAVVNVQVTGPSAFPPRSVMRELSFAVWCVLFARLDDGVRVAVLVPALYVTVAATGVDPATEEQLMSLLGDLASHGRTVLVSTHDLASVMAHFPRVLAMNGGIVADGDASILRDDAILRRTYGGHRPGGPQHIADEHHA